MNDILGVVLSEEREMQFHALTEKRAVSALPIAGRYRLIDFILSNMVNSGIINVGVTTQHNYSSLMDHLGSGRPWDLSRKNYGLHILPPNIGKDHNNGLSGTIDILHGIQNFLRKADREYVLLAQGHIIFNRTFHDMMAFHEERDADITVLYHHEKDPGMLKRSTVLKIEASTGAVMDIQFEPEYPQAQNASMEVFLMRRHLLIKLVEEAKAHGDHSFLMDVLIKGQHKLKIYGFRHEGYVGRLHNVETYYNNNMRFLDEAVRREMFGSSNKIFTKVKDEVPTVYHANADVNDSMVADGCMIDGQVDRSILFRGVEIGRNTRIVNSIIMQNTVLQDGCHIENAVLDKDVVIRRNTKLIGQPKYPVIIGKGAVV